MEINEQTYERYLKLRYSDNTVKQYLRAFQTYSKNLQSQKDVEDYLIMVYNERGSNPFYLGFLKSYIDCFELDFKVAKRLKKRARNDKEYKFLEKEEIDLIIRDSCEWISLLTRLYFDTGLRLRELINSNINDIDVDNRTIEGIGKGNKPFKVKFSGTTQEYLIKWLDKNQRLYPFHYSEADIDHAKSFWYYLKMQCDEIGIPNVHPHRFRHALGHYLRADKGFDLQQIKVKLRHAKLNTTEIYTTATQEEVDDKIDKEVFE